MILCFQVQSSRRFQHGFYRFKLHRPTLSIAMKRPLTMAVTDDERGDPLLIAISMAML